MKRLLFCTEKASPNEKKNNRNEKTHFYPTQFFNVIIIRVNVMPSFRHLRKCTHKIFKKRQQNI